jgi:hypothetical protein
MGWRLAVAGLLTAPPRANLAVAGLLDFVEKYLNITI